MMFFLYKNNNVCYPRRLLTANLHHTVLHCEVAGMHSLFQDYQLVTQLAGGISSNLYLAQSTTHGPADQVVFKIFDSIRLEQTQELERFQQEVHKLKQLHHPYILPLLNGEVGKEHPILVSKYVPRGSLRSRLSSSSSERIPLGEGLQMIVQIGQALSYAHAWNVLHGNIKPENILLDGNGHALLTDFVLQSITVSTVPHAQADTRYTAPEQFEGNINKESDQYALGC